MNVRWRVVGVALLITLAGCGAISPGDSDPTETAVETTVDGGTDADQPVDAFELAEAHRDVLANQTFTATTAINVQYANGTAALRQFGRTRIDPETGAVLLRQTAGGSDPGQFGAPVDGTVDWWANGSGTVFRVSHENGSVAYSERSTRSVPRVEQATRWEDVAALLSALDARFVYGDTVVATGSDVRVAYGQPSDLTVTARVSDGEYLDSYTVSYEVTRDGTPVQVTRTVRFTNVGETTVEQPSWVEGAKNSSS
jgi:hypothetical protein